MGNTIIIWCVVIVFVSVATGSLLISKKKSCRLGIIDHYVAILANTAVVLSLAYAIFSYTHTVYPSYEKEQRLIDAEQKVIELSSENNTLLSDIELTNASYQNVKDEIMLLQEKYSETSHLNYEYENQISNLNIKIWVLEKNLASTIAVNEVSSIIDRAIYLNQSRTTNYQAEILEVANDRIGKYSSGSVEYGAYRILLKFAEEQLKSDSTYSDALNIIIFCYTEYDVLYSIPY